MNGAAEQLDRGKMQRGTTGKVRLGEHVLKPHRLDARIPCSDKTSKVT